MNDRPEVRLAVALNGGVSLAVWMGGVAQQLDLVARASSDPPRPDDSDELTAWRNALDGRRVVVDIIAGTSAGGLNGTLLATARACGAPLVGLRELWRDAGELAPDQLLGDLTAPRNSVLDGTYFSEQVTDGLTALMEKTPTATEPGAPSLTTSLITTATAMSESNVTATDSCAQRFAVADHRRQYLFTAGQRQTYTGSPEFPPTNYLNELSLGNLDPLALAARASAGYPVAFPPVEESAGLAAHRVLPHPESDAPLAWLVDGGILDNEPLDVVIEQIARQPVGEPCERWVLYVVPSAAEAPIAEPAAPEGPMPVWTNVVGSALSFPREINFRSGVDLVATTVRGSGADPGQSLFNEAATDPGMAAALAAAAHELFGTYRRTRTRAAVAETRALLLAKDSAHLLQPADAVREGDSPVEPAAQPWIPATEPSAMAADGSDWRWGLATAERVCRLFLRNLTAPSTAAARLKLSVAITKIAAVRTALEGAINPPPPGSDGSPGSVPLDNTAVESLLERAYDELDAPTTLASIMMDAVSAYAGVPETPADALQLALAVEVVRFATAAPLQVDRTPPFKFLRLGTTADCPGLDVPGQPSYTLPNDSASKLYGSRLHHFGALGSRTGACGTGPGAV